MGKWISNQDIKLGAMKQSAIDCNCSIEDFMANVPVITESRFHKQARKYLDLPFCCDFVSYGYNVVASISLQYKEIVEEFLQKYPAEYCFTTPHLYVLNEKLQKAHIRICYMSEFFLPDVNKITENRCQYRIEKIPPEEISELLGSQWPNALCEQRSDTIVLAIGAYDKDRLIGVSGATQDCDTMWQIGIDVLPKYRGQGIAQALTTAITKVALDHGKIPFYAAAWSNISSVRNAVKSGYYPAWAQMTAMPDEFVKEKNK